MHRNLLPVAAAAGLLGLVVPPASNAQPPDRPVETAVAALDASSPRDEALELTDEEIEIYAELYVELRETAGKYERRMAEIESEREAQEVQARMQQESIEMLERRGWTTEKFERVARAVNRRPDLVEKTLRLIEKRS